MILQGGLFDYTVVFGAGVVMSFTPCVYPLLPVTAAVIAGANVRGSRLNGFLLSLIYVLGLAAAYSSLAVVAVLTGKVFGTLQNDPRVFFVFGNVLLFFALVMLEVIPLPVFSVGGVQSRPRGGWALFVMGAVSGFIVGPCTAPVLGSLLLYIASRQNLFLGTSLLFVFACGMGTSLVLVGTFSGLLSVLPRAGQWMIFIRKAAGFVLIVMAEIMFLRAGSF
ncbi:MAG: hypothetical protein A2293_04950 [Elusimicrobia bacterium RIFOXYB2_FULL_49_7]|nr:MAG: hypothetical protein A2293_04950 [Elusimicrobia bacterium RIFOXYB2_FULL_49_7]